MILHNEGTMLDPNVPALVLAPMDGITDAPMRAFQGALGSFTYGVTEFLRVSQDPIPAKVFRREVPELGQGAKTVTGLPVQVQILGGDPDLMATSALTAVEAGANAIDINFGCPAPTVNRNDGGASLLRYPCRIRDIVRAVRDAVPHPIPVSVKLRLGWDSIEEIHTNARMAVEGGANWLTIHARTRVQGYAPPVYWAPIRTVREALGIPVIANGDIWTRDDFLQCQAESGSLHFMVGRSALANPRLSRQIAEELGLPTRSAEFQGWESLMSDYVEWMGNEPNYNATYALARLKQWVKIAGMYGDFKHFSALKQTKSIGEFFDTLHECSTNAVCC